MLGTLKLGVPISSQLSISCVWGRNLDSILDAECGLEKRLEAPDADFFEAVVTLQALDLLADKILAERPDEPRRETLKLCKRCVIARLDPSNVARPAVCPRGRR